MDYRVEMKQLTSPLRENVKDIGKRIVGFLRDYGEYFVCACCKQVSCTQAHWKLIKAITEHGKAFRSVNEINSQIF